MATRTITFRLDENLHRRLKIKMAEEDRRIQDYITELIRADFHRGDNKQ